MVKNPSTRPPQNYNLGPVSESVYEMDGLSPNFGPLFTWTGGRMEACSLTRIEQAFRLDKALVTVVAKKCAHKHTGKYRVSFHEEQHRKSIASMTKTTARENDYNAVRRNMQNM